MKDELGLTVPENKESLAYAFYDMVHELVKGVRAVEEMEDRQWWSSIARLQTLGLKKNPLYYPGGTPAKYIWEQV